MKSRLCSGPAFRPGTSSVASPVAQVGGNQHTGVKQRPMYLRCQIASTLVCSPKMTTSAPQFMEIGGHPP